MYKHILLIILLSIIILLTLNYCQIGLHSLVVFYNMLVDALGKIIKGGQIGFIIKNLIVILFIPMAISLIINGAVWVFKREAFNFFMPVMWMGWLVLMTAFILQR